jgi:hypothetical protein
VGAIASRGGSAISSPRVNLWADDYDRQP